MRQILVLFVALSAMTIPITLATDPGHDGAMVDGFLDNLRALLRRNDLETVKLPDFDWFSGKSWNILGTEGSLRNLSTLQWADGAAIVRNGNVTNISTSLYIPDALVHYKLTFFQSIDLDVDLKIITNALKLDMDFNALDCSVEYNKIEVYYFENIFPKIRLSLVDIPLVPREFADVVETGIAVAIQITNSILNIIIKPILTAQVSQALASETGKYDPCQVFKLNNEF